MATDSLTSALLRQAWDALGGRADLLDLVEVRGSEEGLLPSTLPALPAMLAAVSASTLAASVLDAARQVRPPQSVRVETEQVAVAARSERYAGIEGTGRTDVFAPLSRFWRSADGWVRLHGNYPWHRDRALGVLGCGERPEEVERAIRAWPGVELENALALAGGVGFAVRSCADWDQHPQGRAVAGLPLLDGAPAPGPGRPLGVGRAAAGARVLDLTRVIAGPVATRTLAAWGAEVLRLDSPRLPELPAQAIDTLPGKRSAVLDLERASGLAQLERLLTQAHVVVAGYRPGALARFGLSAEALAQRHPHLSVVTLAAWGAAGPWSERRGFDSLVQCPTGIALTEGLDGQPGALPAQVLDHATGHLAAAAALLALAGVERAQRPRSVRVSLAQTARWLTGAGTRERAAEREVDPARHLVTLSGASSPVHVIAPPGRIGDLVPAWTSTTELGADPAAFAP